MYTALIKLMSGNVYSLGNFPTKAEAQTVIDEFVNADPATAWKITRTDVVHNLITK